MAKKADYGFGIIEMVVVLAIIFCLAGITIPSYFYWQKHYTLDGNAEEILNTLRLAQNQTLASSNYSQHGVYFDASSSPQKYVLFRGVDYENRDASVDIIHEIPSNLHFSQIDLTNSQVVFQKLTGEASSTGSVILSMADNSESNIIYIQGTGTIGYESPTAITDTRQKDSRHLHFSYGRTIDTATETMTLLFDGSITRQITISQNMYGGQIFWEGKVSVNGSDQIIKIHTNRLNSPDTEFCVHRDGRENNKTLRITISGDTTGSLAEYSANGSQTTHTSIYVENFELQ